MDTRHIAQKLYDHYGSDAKAAKAVGVDQTTINRIRRGAHLPTWKTYQRMLTELQLVEGKK